MPHALRTPVPRAIHALLLEVLRDLRAFVSYVPRAVRALFLHGSFSRDARASCRACSFVPHPSLASGISGLTYASHVWYLSCLVARVILVLELFEFFAAWVEVNHCDMPFLKKERFYNGFSYKCYKSPGSINLTTLTNLMPLVSFYSPCKHQESSGFQGVEKETGMELVNLLTHSH